jgi:hypothetical protein
MAKYGISQALLEATKNPEDNKPTDRRFTVDNPYARVKSTMLGWLASAMRCKAVHVHTYGPSEVVHVFGYKSDIERLDVLYTSLLLQMANGMRQAEVDVYRSGRQLFAWRRSWMLGFASGASRRVRAAEAQAVQEAEKEPTSGTSASLVLASREVQVKSAMDTAYPDLGKPRKVTYSGRGFADGYRKGREANIGGTSVGRRSAGALNG